ncbi:MAG TPA: hypothetical protein VF792_13375 [Ktedonobacterales bacterium]
MSQAAMRSSSSPTPATRVEPRPGSSDIAQRTIAVVCGVTGAALLMLLIWLGSRGLKWFDATLIGYAVASVFSFAAVIYKYMFWLMRPQTGLYFKRGWQLFLSFANFRRYAALVPTAIFTGLLAQTFIRRRGVYRWIMHLCIFWGVILSVAITFPLTFGWLRFTQTSGAQYRIWILGFPFFSFDPYSVFGFVIYHALVFTSILLVIGLVMAYHRRFHDIYSIAIQRFGFDIIPLALLFAIAITGLALTTDSTFFGGAYYWFISLTHEAVVVLWLISLPFGKFFHIIERPATVGIELYWRSGKDTEQRTCPRCGKPFAPAQFVSDLKRTLHDIGQDYSVTQSQAPAAASAAPSATPTPTGQPDIWWQDFCPDCKRIMRGEANMAALGRNGNQFL